MKHRNDKRFGRRRRNRIVRMTARHVVTTYEAIRNVQSPDVRIHAILNVIRWMAKNKLVQVKHLDPSKKRKPFIILDEAGYKLAGLTPVKGEPYGESNLLELLTLLNYCCLGPDIRKPLFPHEIRRCFPSFPSSIDRHSDGFFASWKDKNGKRQLINFAVVARPTAPHRVIEKLLNRQSRLINQSPTSGVKSFARTDFDL